jgi:hypothetical protein
MKENSKNITRRRFLGTTGAVAAGLTILPSKVVSGLGHKAPSDKLNIAVVGIGGMGNSNLMHVAPTENIVALCDVDWGYAKRVFAANPNAKPFWDWRKMYDEFGKSIDAVICATADHSHAGVSANAIQMGKHVYCQKPLTHSVYESRLLTKLAAKYKVATQMGNQGSSDEGVSQTIEKLVRSGRLKLLPIDRYGHRDSMFQKESGYPILLTGIFSSALQRCVLTAACIPHGTGEAGGILVPVLLVIWHAILCIRYLRDSDWVTRSRLREARLCC